MRKFCSIWGGTLFNTAVAEQDSWNLLPRICIPPLRSRGCWDAVSEHRPRWRALSEQSSWGTDSHWGNSKDQHSHSKESSALYFHPLSEGLRHRDDMGKVGTFGLRISKLGQNVNKNLSPETLRLKEWNLSWIFRRGKEPVKLFEGLEKTSLLMNTSVCLVNDKKRDWEVMWSGCKDTFLGRKQCILKRLCKQYCLLVSLYFPICLSSNIAERKRRQSWDKLS